MCAGRSKELTKAMAYLDRLAPNSWMSGWISLEHLGRSGNYEKQAIVFGKLVEYPWAYVACLQSLDHFGISPQYLLAKISTQNPQHPLAEILRARLELSSGQTEDAINRFDGAIEKTSDYQGVAAYYRLSARLAEGDVISSMKAGDIAARHFQIDKPMADLWLCISLSLPAAWGSTPQRIKHLLTLAPEDKRFVGVLASYALIWHWVMGQYSEAYAWARQCPDFHQLPENLKDINQQIYFKYILQLCVAWERTNNLYQLPPREVQILHVLGESHALAPSNAVFLWRGKLVHAKTHFAMGIKMWHLASEVKNHFRACFEARLASIPAGSSVLITVGEIDCRPNGGIWVAAKKNRRDLAQMVDVTVEGYLSWLDDAISNKKFAEVTLQGIPAPAYPLTGPFDPGDIPGFLDMIKLVNDRIKAAALYRGWSFLDVYAATVAEDGTSNRCWYIDGFHLHPAFYAEADKWRLVK